MKTKVLNNSCNQFAYNFYPQSILILEECLQKWWNANLICLVNFMKQLSISERNMKLLVQTVTIQSYKRVACIIIVETVKCIMHCRKYHLHKCNRVSYLHNYNKNCCPYIFLKLGFTPCKAEQPLRGMETTNSITATEIITWIIAIERSTNIPVTESTISKPTDLVT